MGSLLLQEGGLSMSGYITEGNAAYHIPPQGFQDQAAAITYNKKCIHFDCQTQAAPGNFLPFGLLLPALFEIDQRCQHHRVPSPDFINQPGPHLI